MAYLQAILFLEGTATTQPTNEPARYGKVDLNRVWLTVKTTYSLYTNILK